MGFSFPHRLTPSSLPFFVANPEANMRNRNSTERLESVSQEIRLSQRISISLDPEKHRSKNHNAPGVALV